MLSTRPRFCASRAKSLWLQWLIGSPLASGGSQAKAMIEQICAGVKVAGAPGRGISASRSPTLAAGAPASQRCRQQLTVLRHTPKPVRRLAHPHPLASQKDDARPQRHLLRRRMRAHKTLQLRLLVGTQRDRSGWRVRHGNLGRLRFDAPANLTRYQKPSESDFPLC